MSTDGRPTDPTPGIDTAVSAVRQATDGLRAAMTKVGLLIQAASIARHLRETRADYEQALDVMVDSTVRGRARSGTDEVFVLNRVSTGAATAAQHAEADPRAVGIILALALERLAAQREK